MIRAVATRKEAEALLAEVRRSLWAGTYVEPPPARGLPPSAMTPVPGSAISLLGAVDEYIAAKRAEGKATTTLQRYVSNRAVLAASPLGDRLAGEVSPEDIELFRAWRRERLWVVRRGRKTESGVPAVAEMRPGAATNATINRDLLVLSAALNRLVRLRRLPENPVARVPRAKEARKPRVVLSKPEVRLLLRACSADFRPLVLAAVYTGARVGELTRLRWADISFDNATIALFRPKVGNASRIPLHPVLASELRRLRNRQARARPGVALDAEPVFVSSRGRAWTTHLPGWKKTLEVAGLAGREGLTFHSLRHTFACHFLEGGAAVTDLQSLLGHATLSTTALYCRMVDARARESLFALDFGTGRVSPRAPRRRPGPR